MNGTTLFVVGDYGDVQALSTANMVFDAMNQVVGAAVDLIDKPEFIIAVGDNIYPAVANAPLILETPGMEPEHGEEIALLKKLRG